MKRLAPAVTALMVFPIITSVSLAQRPGRPGGGGVDAAAFDAPPLPKDEAESKILRAMEEMHQGSRYRNVSVAYGRLLREKVIKRVLSGTVTRRRGLPEKPGSA